jgi:uncharacterized protein (TIGR03437 family)
VLGRTKVLFDGNPAVIVAMTPTQINAFVPNYLQPGNTTAITVQTDATLSPPVSVPVVAAAPGLATADQSGSGQGAILNQDSSINSPANPAPRGSVISLFGTGEGLVSPQLFSGVLSIRRRSPLPSRQSPSPSAVNPPPSLTPAPRRSRPSAYSRST